MKLRHALLAGALLSLAAAAPVSAAAPANDDFSAATTLSGASAQVTGTNLDATGETGEPDHGNVTWENEIDRPGGPCTSSTVADDACNPSAWFIWTAPADGSTTIDTCGSGYDTVLAVYSGAAVDTLSEVASNDDGHTCGDDGNPVGSSVTFSATSGNIYRIAVAGFNGQQGNLVLRLNPSGSDTTPPDTTIVSGPPAETLSTEAPFAFGASETTYSYQCDLDGAGFDYCPDSLTYLDVELGEHTLQVAAVDPSGNTDATPAVHTWKVVDRLTEPATNPPVAPVVTPVVIAAPPKDTVFAGISLKGGSVTVKNGAASLSLLSQEDASGTLALQTAKAVKASAKKKAKTLKLGSKKFSLKAGKRATVKVKLSRKGRALLARAGKLKARMTVNVKDKAGNARKVTKTVTLKAAKKKRRKR